MKTDILIVGAGPAGIFTAIELLKRGDKRKITVVEKGAAIENRVCPKNKTGLCAGCKNCSITTGFSGAGAFSDGKLSLSEDVGGDLPELVGHDAVKEAIRYVDKIYLDFGADCKVEGVGDNDKIKEIRKKAIQANLKLVDCPIRHLGTEKAQEIYLAIEKHLLKNGVELFFRHRLRRPFYRRRRVQRSVCPSKRRAVSYPSGDNRRRNGQARRGLAVKDVRKTRNPP